MFINTLLTGDVVRWSAWVNSRKPTLKGIFKTCAEASRQAAVRISKLISVNNG